MFSVDIIFLIIVSLSILIGILRGLIKEVISISSLVAALWVSINFGSIFGAYFDVWIDEPGVQLWIGMIVSFIAVILLGMFVARILSKIFRLSLSSKIDRFLGACFGFLRGCILTAIFVLAGELTTATDKKWWDESNLIPYSKILADKMIMNIPANIDFIRTEKGKE